MSDPAAEEPLSKGALAKAFSAALGQSPLGVVEADMASQAYDDYRPDELPGLRAEDLALNLADFWRYAEHRPDGDALVRLIPAQAADGRRLGLDLLEIVQDDAPFLVDSVMAQLSEGGFSVMAMFHPVVTVGRDEAGSRDPAGRPRRESMILIVLGDVGEDREEGLLKELAVTLADARSAVDDFGAMTSLLRQCIAELRGADTGGGAYGVEEYLDFLRWMAADRFVFLGARAYLYPRGADGDYAHEAPSFDPRSSLGVLRDPTRTILRRASEPAVLASDLKAYLDHSAPVQVGKANLRTRVHRRTHADLVGIKRYGPDGAVYGEVRFVGLFTSDVYEDPVRSIPVVRRKVAHVLDRAGENPSEHSEKRLRHIVETYPRDELFQIDEAELLAFARGILHLFDRPRTRLFVRKDPLGRFVSVFLYVPRDRYESELQGRLGEMIAKAFGGEVSVAYPSWSEQPLARIQYIIRLPPGVRRVPDIRVLEAELAEACHSWTDRFEASLRAGGAEPGRVAEMVGRYSHGFPAGYRELFDAEEALADVAEIEALGEGGTMRVRAYRTAADSLTTLRVKLYRPDHAADLSDILPILDHMGLKARLEHGFPIRLQGDPARTVWVHDLILEDGAEQSLIFTQMKAPFEEAFLAVWAGEAENDGFNRLVISTGMSWREASLIRALARYRQQTGLDPSQAVQTQALDDHPDIASQILALFKLKFDPAAALSAEERATRAEAAFADIAAALQSVASLDADRVLRRLALTVKAMLRTNYYQPDADGAQKPYISFKLASDQIEDLPRPKPYREIFVCSPQIEGVHLRFGPVARGGLRWSDRRDDFRTEVLGLVKAQQVKNAVIVPVGAKGGFYPKQLPRGGAADAVKAEAVAAYKTFLHGLLDITDNLAPDGAALPPHDVIAVDAPDPYLVVAADKGTATFSDIANGEAEAYGFWLGDAFASGGSAGYDHKAMGITARGAWEAVKRHFRELGKDIQTEPFTVIGVGDMSGDVFGNGMLLSQATKLVAAFDHRHVFLDPDPDPAVSFKERQRLFDLPRSSWDDYDKSLISKGGGVFPRTAKSVELTPEIKALLEVTDDALAPSDLIRAVLKAPAELLYLGGIGAYVKAPNESNAQVGDKANDAVRVDAGELRVKVVGEGANLGVTQAGRIAFARAGGKINTDAIDNSAGVDTSDHEVNIKILTGQAERAGRLTRPERDALLASMTDEVAAHVLAHNKAQTLALSLQEAEAVEGLDAHAEFMLDLVAAGRLDRAVEGLPGPASLAELRLHGKGLTRPELAVLTAYGKLELSAALVDGKAPDDPYFERVLKGYFPKGLADFEAEMSAHPLRREIISTVMSNAIVDMAGPTFAHRVADALGCDAGTVAQAFEAARRIFGLDDLWRQAAELGPEVPAAAQTALLLDIAQTLRGRTFWLARRAHGSVQALIDQFSASEAALAATGDSLLSDHDRMAIQARGEALIDAGAPEALARTVACLHGQSLSVEIADLARERGWPVEAAGRLYHRLGAALGVDRLRTAAGALKPADTFERLAIRGLLLELVAEQTTMTGAVMAASSGPEAGADAKAAEAAVKAWTDQRRTAAERASRTLDAIEAETGGWSFAKLSLAVAALRDIRAAG